LLARGIPLLLAGDEVGNSQDGNNNAYCQDNAVGWVDWSHLGADDDMVALVAQLTDLRRRFPQLRAATWLDGRRPDGSWDVLWLTPQGTEMTEQDWGFHGARFIAYVLAPTQPGGAALCIVLNAGRGDMAFTLPVMPDYATWTLLLDTAWARAEQAFPRGTALQAPAHSVLVFSGAV
jgi:glycogen operon protein